MRDGKTIGVRDPVNPAPDCVPNIGVIDNNQAGPDNRPVPEGPWTHTATTGSDGTATWTFTVSMQPGNNYRAAATVIDDVFDPPPPDQPQVTQAMADLLGVKTSSQGTFVANGGDSGYKVPVVWSEMLTVWRKLHVETDSMARPTFAENTINIAWNEPRFPNGVLVLDINDQDNSDQFDNGFIRIEADGFPDIVARIITFENPLLGVDDVIHTSVTEAQWGARPALGQGVISDDDLADQARFSAGVVGSDLGTGNPPTGFLPLPDTSGLVAHYKPAYILPVVEEAYTSTGAIPFVRNINNVEDAPAWDSVLPFRGLPVSTLEFWTAYVYSAFQAEQWEDFDGELKATKGINTHKESSLGNTRTYSDFGPQYTGMLAVFVEALRNGFLEIQQRITVAHEMAHTLGVDHSDQLMHEEVQTNEFSAGSLVELRTYQGP